MRTASRQMGPAEQIQAGARGNGCFSAPEQAQNNTARAEGSPAAKRTQNGGPHRKESPVAKPLQTGISRGKDPSVKGTTFLCRTMRPEDVPACAAIEAAVPDGWSAGALTEELLQPTARLFVAEMCGSDIPGAQPNETDHISFAVNGNGGACPVLALPEQPPDGQTANVQLPDGQTTNTQPPDGQATNMLPPDGQAPNTQPPDGQTPNTLPPDGQTPNVQSPGAQTFHEPPLHPQSIAALAVFQLVCEEASLYTISTASTLRRQGAARALLQFAFAQLAAQGAQTVFLEVRAQNEAARALYAALGFEETGTRRGFYTKPADDAVLMQRTIGTSRSTAGHA